MKPQAAMVFAAGLGTRMGPLTKDRPKPMIEVAGKPLVDHAVDLAVEAGIGRIVVNVHYYPEAIRDHLSGRPGVRISDESDALLETGGGLRRALPLLESEAVFTINSDAVWTGRNPFAELREAWRPEAMGALLLLVRSGDAYGHFGRGDFHLGGDGRLSRGPEYVYSGAQIISTASLGGFPSGPFSLNLVWDQLMREGRLFGWVHDGKWCDVGQPSSIAIAEAMMRGKAGV